MDQDPQEPTTQAEIIWRPSNDAAAASAYARFAKAAGYEARDYAALHQWSVSDLEGFWSLMWDFAGIIGEKGSRAFVPDPERWMTGARFFPEARLNLAQNLMRLEGSAIAVITLDEQGARRAITAEELARDVARVASGMRACGLGVGDRVAAVLPNGYEALLSLLASLSIGAVWTSCSPDFGDAAILDRIGQVAPKLLFTCETVRYGGKDLAIGARMRAIAAQIESLACVIGIEGAGACPFERFEDFGAGGDGTLSFTPLPFDAPAYILYTSGTTGKPKAIVHKAGGVLMQMVKEHLLHGDIRAGDSLLWYCNTAWMMYHWMIGAMACGATVVLYDGAPILKDSAEEAHGGLNCRPLWEAVAAERITHLGISPKYLATLSDAGFRPRDATDLSSLRWLLSAGSPMAPWQYDWIYDAIAEAGGPMGFASISGGTDLLGCFLLGHPALPLRKGTLTAKGLGMAVQALDARGASVIGRAGELVCTEPFPSMPLTFWGEDGTARYHAAYFSAREEIWTHGDQLTLTPEGAAVIHGRSDFTLNPGGVRIGTADLYNICDQIPELADQIAFGRPLEGSAQDEEIVLCVTLKEGATLDAPLAKEIRQRLRSGASPRHVPAAIYAVPAIPYTINAKRVEGAAKAASLGQPIKNMASLANPDALSAFRLLQESAAF